MSDSNLENVIIIGSGPAGLTAGIYAARAGLSPLIIAGNQIGGQLTITSEIENFPGVPKTSGFELMDIMQKQAKELGVRIENDHIDEVDFSGDIKILKGKTSKYLAKAIIIATGATARWLGLPSERKFRGHGVSACAVCDGFFFAGKKVAIVGGGDTALEDASYLSGMCEKVYLIHRRGQFRACHKEQSKTQANPKIEQVLECVVEEVLGSDDPLAVTGVKVKNLVSGESRIIDVSALFLAIGHHPNTDIVKDVLPLDEQNYIITAQPDKTTTAISGVFAAGDVISGSTRQAIVAAASGCNAALSAEAYLNSL